MTITGLKDQGWKASEEARHRTESIVPKVYDCKPLKQDNVIIYFTKKRIILQNPFFE